MEVLHGSGYVKGINPSPLSKVPPLPLHPGYVGYWSDTIPQKKRINAHHKKRDKSPLGNPWCPRCNNEIL